jgi:hypothetical protein
MQPRGSLPWPHRCMSTPTSCPCLITCRGLTHPTPMSHAATTPGDMAAGSLLTAGTMTTRITRRGNTRRHGATTHAATGTSPVTVMSPVMVLTGVAGHTMGHAMPRAGGMAHTAVSTAGGTMTKMRRPAAGSSRLQGAPTAYSDVYLHW